MSRLLIIGASILQLPAIKKARELGHYIAVADYNPNAIGIPFANEFYNASTIDCNAICNVAKVFKPDGIITLATDMPMRALAAATEMLGIPGISSETALKATDKGAMIQAFKHNNVESPWFFIIHNSVEFEEIKKKLSFPCIIKPTDNSGSRGVILVHKESELDNAYFYSKSQARKGEVIIEEYMQGKEVSVEVIVIGGKTHILAITDKLTTGSPFFVEMGHCQQSQLPEVDIVKIKKLTEKAITAIGIEYGPAHVEIILTKEGPKMVEIGARMGGDCITTHLVPLSTGIDMVKATIDISLNKIPNIEPLFNMGSAIRYFNSHCGFLKSIKGIELALKMEGVKEIEITKNVGDEITAIHSSIDRIGYIISQGKNAETAILNCEKAMANIEFIIN